MKIKKLYILLFLSFIYVQSMAQHKCGSDEYYNYQIATYPEFAKNQERLEQATKEYLKSNNLKSASVGANFKIPVVVHVLYNTEIQNIKESQIQAQIDSLNNDYQLKNTDRIKCPDYFKHLQANCQIEFELAKRDPSGNCTNGIVRKHTSNTFFLMGGIIDGGFSADKDNAKFTSKGGDDAWDPSSYLNIWVVPQIQDKNGNVKKGYAQRPGGVAATDGVVICSSDFGIKGNGSIAWSYGRTATHEIGHWLNLNHIWGSCIVGDGVDDTPNQFGPHEEECPEGIKKSCPGEPYGDMYMNYMDYTDDECMNMFTTGQKMRMHAALLDPTRVTILRYNNLALIPPLAELSIINPDAPTSVAAGDAITVNFAEFNSGSLNAPPNYVNIHLSKDDILTPGLNDDIYLDQYYINQTVTGLSQTIEFSKQITIPSDVTPRDYYLFYAADGTGVVTECDNTDNFASVKITVKASTELNPPRNLTAVAGNEQVTLTWLAPSSGSPSSYNIYRNTSENGTYTLIGTGVKTTTKTILGLSNGTTYWFYVEAVYATGEKAASTKVSAKPFALIKLSNDDCSGAKSITSSSSCNYLENQTVNNATASSKPKGSCDNYTGTPDLADVWYYFKAQSTSHTITVDPNGSQLDAVIVAYSSCTSSTGINCSDVTGGPGMLSTLNLSGLVIGNSYYIRVYDYGKQTTMGNFRICVSGENSVNSCAPISITPNTKTHGSARFSTTPGTDDINFTAQPNCAFEITNYCSWLTISPMSGIANNSGLASVNYTIEANNSTIVRQCTFYINGSPVTITQNGEDATDDDNDGVINSLDLCPNTPSGEVIDANGCSHSQVFSEVKYLQYNDVVLNTPQNRTISFSNEGLTDFTITSINITGTNANQFSVAPIPPIVVSTGAYQNLTVTFNPTSVGAKTAQIIITTNTAQIPTKTITLNGNGVDQLTRVLVCNPATSYNFGDIKKAETSSKYFVIQNTGSNTLTISNLVIEGLNPEPYSITYARTVPYDIGPGLTELVTVKFSPTSLGVKSATLVITNNSDNLSPKYSIGLSGNGTDNYYIGSISNLIALEYWFDDNYQTKVNTPATALFDSDLGTQIPTEGIESGLHIIHIRYQDNKGKWSSIVSDFFHKSPFTPVASPKIIASEYWFDDGFASKVSTAITPGQTITANGGFEVGSLANGLHVYHVRYKDDAGQWSSVVSEFFQKLPVAQAGSRNITASEYWFDNDFSSKISAAITPGQSISISGGFDVSSLASGLHSYHVRYKDDAGQWSSVVSEFFQKLPVTASGSRTITASEYWFDNEFASKVSTAITPGQTITAKGGFEVGSLANGLHVYHVRYKDDAGQWSSVVSEFFQKLPASVSGTNLITTYRYWFDSNNQAMITVNLPNPVTPYQLVRNINTCSLTKGDHTIHFQFEDSNQAWSSVATETITVDVSSVVANAGTISGSTNVCQGQSIVTYTVPTIANATDYIWTLPTGATGTSTTNSISVNYGASAVSGNITVKGTNACGDGLVSTLAITVNSMPTSPTIGTITQPTCSVATGSVVLSGLPTGNWTINPGAITGSSSSKTISGLAAGTYNFTVTNASGCISDASADVVINDQPETPTPVITQNGMILHSDALTGNQWYNQSGIINGATGQEYTVTANGDYYVIVTLVCSSSASNIISIVNTGIDFGENNKSIKVYPNPVSKELIIEFEGNKEMVNFEIVNSVGQSVYKGNLYDKTNVKTEDFKPGLYFIKLDNGSSFELIKIVKL